MSNIPGLPDPSLPAFRWPIRGLASDPPGPDFSRKFSTPIPLAIKGGSFYQESSCALLGAVATESGGMAS